MAVIGLLAGLASVAPAGASVAAESHAQPTTKAECKRGGWETFTYAGFRNQGDCVSFVQRGNFTCRDVLGCVTYDEGDPIRVATSLATSGSVVSLGVDSLQGVEIALDRLGPVRGHGVELSNFDSSCSFGGGEAAANAIIADSNIVGVIGTSCSGAATAAAPILSAAGFTMISPSNTSPALTDPATHSPGYFRTVESDALQGVALADHFWAAGAITAAVIVDPDPYTYTLEAAFTSHFASLGGTNLITARVELDGSNTADAVAEAMSAGIPDVIVILTFEPNGSGLVNEIRSNPALDATALASSDALYNGVFFGNAGPNSQGMSFTTFDDSFTDSSVYRDFISDYIAEFGFPTAPFHAMAADATDLLLDGVSRVGVIDGNGTLHIGRQALRDALASTPGLNGLTGTITCTPLGECGATGHMVVVPFP